MQSLNHLSLATLCQFINKPALRIPLARKGCFTYGKREPVDDCKTKETWWYCSCYSRKTDCKRKATSCSLCSKISMNQDKQLQLAQPHPHLAVALLLMQNDTDVTRNESDELIAIIQETDIKTGVMMPLKVVF